MGMGAPYKCCDIQDLYLEAACGGGQPELPEAARRHLSECPGCHRWVTQLRRMDADLSNLPMLEAPSFRGRPGGDEWIDPRAREAGRLTLAGATLSGKGSGWNRGARHALRFAWVPAVAAAGALAAVWTSLFLVGVRRADMSSPTSSPTSSPPGAAVATAPGPVSDDPTRARALQTRPGGPAGGPGPVLASATGSAVPEFVPGFVNAAPEYIDFPAGAPGTTPGMPSGMLSGMPGALPESAAGEQPALPPEAWAGLTDEQRRRVAAALADRKPDSYRIIVNEYLRQILSAAPGAEPATGGPADGDSLVLLEAPPPAPMQDVPVIPAGFFRSPAAAPRGAPAP